MQRSITIAFLFLVVPLLVGCPGNRALDREANEALWAWVEQQDTNGWNITGYATNYQNIVVAHEFKPTRLSIAIQADRVNPLHQRNMMDMIAMQWRNFYPANMRPRFNLRVMLYDTEINRDKELGWSEIDRDGNVETHHAKTQDIM
jgi:hypothetical protein